MTDPPVSTQSDRRRRLIGLGGLGLLAAGGAYVVAVLVAGDDLPRGTTIAGVPVGGLSRSAAADRLDDDLADRAAALEVEVGGQSREVAPEDAGLSVDVAASVAQVAGGSRWSPGTLWDRFTGGDDLDAVVDVDDEQLSSYLASLDEQVATEPVEGAIRFEPKGIKVTEPVVGTALDTDGARDGARGGVPRSGRRDRRAASGRDRSRHRRGRRRAGPRRSSPSRPCRRR